MLPKWLQDKNFIAPVAIELACRVFNTPHGVRDGEPAADYSTLRRSDLPSAGPVALVNAKFESTITPSIIADHSSFPSTAGGKWIRCFAIGMSEASIVVARLLKHQQRILEVALLLNSTI